MKNSKDFIKKLRDVKQKFRNHIYLDEMERFISRNKFFADFYDNVFRYASSESTFDEIHKTHMKKYTEQKQRIFNPDISDEATEEDDTLSEELFSSEEYELTFENLTATLVLGFIANLENQLKEIFRLLSLDIRDEEEKKSFIRLLEIATIPNLIKGMEELNLIDSQLSSINTINTFYNMINVHKHGKGRALDKLEKTNAGCLVQDQNDDLFTRLIGKTSIKIEKEMFYQIKNAIDELWTNIKIKNKENLLNPL